MEAAAATAHRCWRRMQVMPGNVAPKANSLAILQGFAKHSRRYAQQSATIQCILKDIYEAFTNDFEHAPLSVATSNLDFETFFAIKTEELNELKATEDKKTVRRWELRRNWLMRHSSTTAAPLRCKLTPNSSMPPRRLANRSTWCGSTCRAMRSRARRHQGGEGVPHQHRGPRDVRQGHLAWPGYQSGLCRGCEAGILLRVASDGRSQGQGQQHPQPAPGHAGRTDAPGEIRPLRCGNQGHRRHDSDAQG
eukprot:TRINITY_DN8090_c0_g3_i2.p1 TRINITY_DN8090_c0_g3~~TRINITY_DN8090_c0_g3_i2.p1  ORF type:complete len:250 (+),score=26.53 TRINITY_DN8090_c0_g3_i2:111-860(+)